VFSVDVNDRTEVNNAIKSALAAIDSKQVILDNQHLNFVSLGNQATIFAHTSCTASNKCSSVSIDKSLY